MTWPVSDSNILCVAISKKVIGPPVNQEATVCVLKGEKEMEVLVYSNTPSDDKGVVFIVLPAGG